MIKKTFTILAGLLLSWSSQAQFFENFTTPTYTWTPAGVNVGISATQVKFTGCADGQSNRIYTNHGLTMTDNWVLETDFQFTAVGTGGPGHHIASVTAGTQDPVSGPSPTYTATNQSAIAMMFYSTNHTNNPSSFELVGTCKNGSGAWTNSAGIVLSNGKTYYLRLERLDATHARVSAFMDPARTVHATNSPQCFNLGIHFTNNLSVIQHGNSCWGSPDRILTGWIDNTRLTSYTTSEIIAGNQQVCSGTGNPVAFTSSATSNNPDVTYQWQASTDGGITWTNVGANSATYDPPAGITQNTLYRRLTTHTSCGDQHFSNTISVTVVNCNNLPCDYSNDFSSAANWTTEGTGLDINGGTFNYNNCSGGVSNRMFTNHNVALTNNWRLDFDFNFTDFGTGGPGHHLASLTSGTLDPVSGSNGSPWVATNQDAVAAMFYSTNHTDTESTFMLVGCSKNDNSPWVLSSGILLEDDTQYFITLERLDQTHGRISVYSNAARTVHVANSPQCFAINAGVTSNLNILQHGNTSWAGSDRSLTGTIDNDCLSLLNFTGGTITYNQKVPCGTAPNTIMSTSPASGPNNFYTFTYVWEQSTDNVNWTAVVPAATALNFSPPILYQTTYYRRVATGPCGMTLISNTITKTVSLNTAYNSEFSLNVNCQSGQANFSVEANPVVSSGNNFLGTWTITDITAGTPSYSDPSWNNDDPCYFAGYNFIQGHVYEIVYTVQDICTQPGSTLHTVTCSAGMILQDGREIDGKTTTTSAINPNPTNGVFTVEVKDLNATEVSIYNAQGRLIRSVMISNDAISSRFDLSDQPSGIYLVNIRTEDGILTHKLIKE
ncbi:MAG: thrombospondin type 3 repeat family [Fluviicola sp.]|jgi:hypothetical protein|uniref:T9SS type A sorting domain-containing protein n=1 Tax=Fluviicola sp. TaxID=1917219 RepID=UPI0026338A1A|nr:T9SS type A sorting domain-containing protein [Fluviicola sp.]MDF3028961.1 thrombospondin type 3 repeat family [Fluviicola sp.]